jgi:biotin carboxyl carrier protein
MKMENTICAEEDGTVEDVYVEDAQFVEAGVLLLKIKEGV